MKQVWVTARGQWRRWLAAHHDQEQSGIWLVFSKQATGKPSLDYEAAVEEDASGMVHSLFVVFVLFQFTCRVPRE